MKKKALATKMAAFVMAGAMTMSMGGFTAFAVEAEFSKTVSITNAKKNNEIEKNVKVKAPNTAFGFKITPAGKIELTQKVTENGTEKTEKISVSAGIEGGLKLKGTDATKPEGETADLVMTPAIEDYTVAGKIVTNDETFAGKPGTYHYLLEETAGSYDGMEYITTVKYDVYVFVTNATSDNIKLIAVKREGGTAVTDLKEKESTINFVNPYTTTNLLVRKQVTGNQGDKGSDNKFKFTINVNGADGEEYSYVIYNVDDNGNILSVAENIENDKFTSKAKKNIELAHNQAVKIYGLSAQDTYTVTEDAECADKGYTTSISVNGTEVDKKGETSVYVTSDNAQGSTDNTVLYTNNKQVSTPTGIVTEYAPYILLVAAAGAFAVLFLRRRKEEF